MPPLEAGSRHNAVQHVVEFVPDMVAPKPLHATPDAALLQKQSRMSTCPPASPPRFGRNRAGVGRIRACVGRHRVNVWANFGRGFRLILADAGPNLVRANFGRMLAELCRCRGRAWLVDSGPVLGRAWPEPGQCWADVFCSPAHDGSLGSVPRMYSLEYVSGMQSYVNLVTFSCGINSDACALPS